MSIDGKRKIRVTLEVTFSNYTHSEMIESGVDVEDIEAMDDCEDYSIGEIAEVFEDHDGSSYDDHLAGSNLFIHFHEIRVISAEDA